MTKLILLSAALWLFDVWPFSVGAPFDYQTEYMPEVVYWSGRDEATYLGPRVRDRDMCINLAHDQSRRIAGANASRIISTHCRIMRGERFLDRAR